MSNIYSNDDDIFEDYVEQSSNSANLDDPTKSSSETFDKAFSDIDTPFKSLVKNSSLKVNFGEAFYGAAHEWVMQGYRESNNVAVINELARITDGEFLYRHRLIFCKESIIRKKTVLKFLSLILDGEETKAFVRSANENFSVNFTETYFNMSFRSFYNILLDTYWNEVALYKTLCEITNTDIDINVYDLNHEDDILSVSDHINNLYVDYFEKTDLHEKLQRNIDEIFTSKA